VATGGSFPYRFLPPKRRWLVSAYYISCVFLISIIGLLMQISPKFTFLPLTLPVGTQDYTQQDSTWSRDDMWILWI